MQWVLRAEEAQEGDNQGQAALPDRGGAISKRKRSGTRASWRGHRYRRHAKASLRAKLVRP